jgi:hypothetical protein
LWQALVRLLCLRTLGMHWLRGLAYHYASSRSYF